MKMNELVSKTLTGEEAKVAVNKKVTSVNNIFPDKNGNVEIEISSGIGVPIEKFGAVGDGITDDTEAFRRAIEESPEGTTFFLENTYLVNNVWKSSDVARRKLSFVGGNNAKIKIKPNILSVTDHGTSTGLTYQVKDYFEEINTSGLGWTVELMQLHTGRIFQYIKVPDKTTIPSSIDREAILRGALTRLQFEVSYVDTNDPDGVGTARIYFYGATNNEKGISSLDFDALNNLLIENLQIKPYLQKDVWLLDFGVNSIPPSFANNRKITQLASGKVARIHDTNVIYVDKDGVSRNFVEVNSFNPSQLSRPYEEKRAPLNDNEDLKVEEFEVGSMSFLTLNKCEEIFIDNIDFDGSNYEVGSHQLNANNWNIIYTDSVRKMHIQNCSFNNAVMAGVHIGGAHNGASVYSDMPDDVLINNCTFSGNGRNDIEIIHGRHIRISNCIGDNSLDIEMNSHETVEKVFISDCSFDLFSPFSPSPISSTCEVSVVNCRFNRASAQVGATAKISNSFIHSVGCYNANALEFMGCTINKISGMYGQSVPTFNNCQIYGLPNGGAASINEGERSLLRLNNSVLDLSFCPPEMWHGSWGFDFRDSTVISKTHVVTLQKVYIEDFSEFHGVTFNNVVLENGSESKEMKFYNCQFLCKDPLGLTGISGWGEAAKIYLQNCFLQVGINQTASLTMIDCILDGVVKPTFYALQGININGLKSNLPQGIDWQYLEAPYNSGFKAKFNNVFVSKNIPGLLGVFGGPDISNVEEGSTAFYMDDPTQFGQVTAYQDLNLITQSIGGGGGGSSASLNDDWNLNVTTGTYRILYPGGFSALQNHPIAASNYGLLHVIADANSVSQQYIPHNTEGFYYRTKFNADDWTVWNRFATSEEATIWNEGMLQRSSLYDDDWNLVLQAGTYRVFTTALTTLNRPAGAYDYGTLAVFSNGLSVSQLYFPQDATQGMYSRTKFGATDWTPWNQTGGSKIQVRTDDPATPEVGQMWLRSDL